MHVLWADLNSMVVNKIKLLDIAVKVKLPVAGMDCWSMDLSDPRIIRHKAWGCLDLHRKQEGVELLLILEVKYLVAII